MNKLFALIISLLAAVNGFAKDIAISDGEYVFQHKFAEHPNMPSIQLNVIVKGVLVTVINADDDEIFPLGIIDQGELFWHKGSDQWIIVDTPEDKDAKDVGGCSVGPTVIDLKEMVYWTC
ncbi:MAG: hypothetical protein ACI9OH_000892 [Oleispira sp.]|jgi:hypothetical protein